MIPLPVPIYAAETRSKRCRGWIFQHCLNTKYSRMYLCTVSIFRLAYMTSAILWLLIGQRVRGVHMTLIHGRQSACYHT